MAQQILSTNTFTTAKWIVDATSSSGTHTTIASAITSASSGDTIFIRTGTYTENITLKAGVNLTAFGCDGLTTTLSSQPGTSNVTILGSLTCSYSGSVCISGIQLKTNGAAALITSGSNVGELFLSNCTVFANDSTGITMNNANNFITFFSCYFISTSTNLLFASTVGAIDFECCVFALSSTASASTTATNNIYFNACDMAGVSLSTTSTGSYTVVACRWSYGGVTLLTTAGTGTSSIYNSFLASTTASCISVGSGTTVEVYHTSISSSNTNAITGAGTLKFSSVSFPSTSNVINTTTQTGIYTDLGKYKATRQSAFLVNTTNNILNVTGDGTVYTIVYDNEVYDQGSDMTTTTFTCPVTGKVLLAGECYLFGGTILSAVTYQIVTSNRTYSVSGSTIYGGTTTVSNPQLSILADMDAADIATTTIAATDSGGKVDDIVGTVSSTTVYTRFCGQLTC